MHHLIDTPLLFPDGFLWGTATAGHQIEGGNVHSNWWTWEQEGLVKDGTRSGRACDYWNRYSEDHALMQEHGHNVFRLGVEWARIEPEPGRIDREAVARYRAILEDLRARGLQVCLTLNHWVVPQWFADRESWLAADALQCWEAFVRLVARELGDLVDLWVTLNEPMVPVLAGYLSGYHPPCRRSPLQAARVFHRLLQAHALAYHVLHEMVPRAPTGGPSMVGFAGAYQLVEPFHESGA
jgi:beta-glucosidase